jgi:NAD(P)-dependent dehydrogenase (short-subunit alcohol dehydrogenase family)
MPEKSLAGQVALITGAAKRIGRSIALRLAAEGADIVITYDSSKSEAEQLVEKLKSTGRRAVAIQADVSHRADVQKVFTAVENEFGRLDILVNNAGMFFAAKFEELTEEQWDHIMNVNLKSQFLCAQSAAPIMKRQGRGHIINLTSLGGMLPWPTFTHYCVSKAGAIMLTHCARHNPVSRRSPRRRLHPARPPPSHRHRRRYSRSSRLPGQNRFRNRPNPSSRRRPLTNLTMR